MDRTRLSRSRKLDSTSQASIMLAIAASSCALWLLFSQLNLERPGSMLFATALCLIAGVCTYFAFRRLLKPARRRALLFAAARGASASFISFLVTAALLAAGVALADFAQNVRGLPASPAWTALLQAGNLGGIVFLTGTAMYAWLPTLVGSVISIVLEWTVLRDEPTRARE